MAFMRKKRKLRSRFRRRKGPSIRTVNNKVKAIQAKQENKALFTTQSIANLVSGTPQFAIMNLIAVGDTNIDRDGEFATLTSIQWRAHILPATSNAVSQTVRHIVFWDFQSNSSILPALTTMLNSTAPTSAYLNQGVTQRFKVIHDKMYNLQYTSNTAAPTVNCRKTINKKKIDFSRKVTWNTGQDGTLPFHGALYSAWLTDAATNGATILADFKVGFKDD